jgi:uncharacterized integral membrane protein (TIGR00698 family)
MHISGVTTPPTPARLPAALLPGAALCVAIAITARLLQRLEERVLGQPYLEALVLAILLGAAVRAIWTPDMRWTPGIRFSAKGILEFAVALLGLSVDLPALVRNGAALPVAIAIVVAATLAGSYALGRALGLGRPLAVLIACGNAICGNSAIAAVAPAIEADGEDVAAAIAITAAMGVVVVVWLPALMPLLGLTATQYGAVAGLTVYAVPQVVAATVPAGAAAVQMGTLVKLLRVLLLGPVVAGVSYLKRQRQRGRVDQPKRVPLVPWFIAAFVVLALVRATGIIPITFVDSTRATATSLTILSMAALGLGVDLRALARVGPRVVLTVAGSLALLGGSAIVLVRLLRIL